MCSGVSGVTRLVYGLKLRGQSVTVTVIHLPATHVRSDRISDDPGLSNLACRILPAILKRRCVGTARAISERYDVSKDTANKALRNLVTRGYLKRWNRSAGRDTWVHFVVATDEPFAWEIDPALAAHIVHTEDQAMARARATAEPLEPLLTVPAPRPAEPTPPDADDESSQVTSRPGSSAPKNQDATNRGTTGVKTPPYPRSGSLVPKVVPRGSRYQVRMLRKLARIPREHEQHLHTAIAMLDPIGFAPLVRMKFATTLVAALAAGYTHSYLSSVLSDKLGNARDVHRVVRWRLDNLAAALVEQGALVVGG